MVTKIKLREVLKFLLAIWLCSERKLKIFLVVSSGSLISSKMKSKFGLGISYFGILTLKFRFLNLSSIFINLSQPRFFRGCKRFLKRIAPKRCPQLGEQVKFSFSLCFVTRIRKRGAGSSMSFPRNRACVPLRLLRTTVKYKSSSGFQSDYLSATTKVY